MTDERDARQSWTGWEWGLLALTAAALVLVAAWPTWRAPQMAPPGAEPVGVAVGVRDGLVYLSLVRQDVGLSPVLRSPFAEPGRDRIFWGTYWWGLAHVRQLTGASPATVFHGARYVMGVACVWAIAWFATLATRTRGERWLVIQLATWGGGFGWLVSRTGLNGYRSADLLTPETSTFYTVMSMPHLAGALALMIGCFAAALAATERNRVHPWGWLAGLLALGLGVFHPFNVLVVLGAWGLYGCLLLRERERCTAWLRCTWPLAVGCILTIGFFGGVLLLYPEGLPTDTVIRRFPYVDMLLGFGLLGMGAAAYVVLRIARREWDAPFAMSAAWIAATVLLMHSYPLLKQEGRAILGLHVPLATWTGLLLLRAASRWPAAARATLATLCVLATMPTMFTVLRERTQRFASVPGRYYVLTAEAQAATALAAQVTSEDRIACTPLNGLLLGAQVPARLFLGKWNEATAVDHERALGELFGADTPPDARRAVIDRYGITVLWIAAAERAAFDASGLAAAVRELRTAVLLDQGGVLAVRVATPGSA